MHGVCVAATGKGKLDTEEWGFLLADCVCEAHEFTTVTTNKVVDEVNVLNEEVCARAYILYIAYVDVGPRGANAARSTWRRARLCETARERGRERGSERESEKERVGETRRLGRDDGFRS